MSFDGDGPRTAADSVQSAVVEVILPGTGNPALPSRINLREVDQLLFSKLKLFGLQLRLLV